MQLGYTPLTMACEKGHVEIVQKLIEAGADVNLYDQVFIDCVRWTHPIKVKILLRIILLAEFKINFGLGMRRENLLSQLRDCTNYMTL